MEKFKPQTMEETPELPEESNLEQKAPEASKPSAAKTLFNKITAGAMIAVAGATAGVVGNQEYNKKIEEDTIASAKLDYKKQKQTQTPEQSQQVYENYLLQFKAELVEQLGREPSEGEVNLHYSFSKPSQSGRNEDYSKLLIEEMKKGEMSSEQIEHFRTTHLLGWSPK